MLVLVLVLVVFDKVDNKRLAISGTPPFRKNTGISSGWVLCNNADETFLVVLRSDIPLCWCIRLYG